MDRDVRLDDEGTYGEDYCGYILEVVVVVIPVCVVEG